MVVSCPRVRRLDEDEEEANSKEPDKDSLHHDSNASSDPDVLYADKGF